MATAKRGLKDIALLASWIYDMYLETAEPHKEGGSKIIYLK
jgi:hypothetical protein